QYGSGAPGPYGSAPGQFGSAGPAAQKSPRTGPGLLGPLTLRDLFLLFAGLLSLVVLFVPFKSDGFLSWSLWHWTVDSMGTLTFDVFGIWLIVAAVFVSKFGNGGLKVGSLSLDQAISVLSGAAFTFAFVHLLTSVQFWHVGAYLAFFAALIAFFAGVFTMLPFFNKEFAIRDEVAAHPKARPVTKHVQHPAPVANMPGGHNGPGGFGAPYGSQPNGGQPNGAFGSQGQPGAPAHPGQPGGPGQFGGQSQVGQPGGPDQFGQPGQQGQPGQFGASGGSGPADQFNQHNQVGSAGQFDGAGQPGGPGQVDEFGQNDQPDGQDQFGQPIGSEQNSPYAPPEEQAQGSSFESAPGAGESADQAVQSTGSGQTYLGAQHSQDPKHTQSEPTQTFGFGAHREESPWSNDGETAVQAPVPADSSGSSDARISSDPSDASADSSNVNSSNADSSSATESKVESGNDDSSNAGTAAAVAGAGAVGIGAAAAGVASAHSDSDKGSESDRGSGSDRVSDTDRGSESDRGSDSALISDSERRRGRHAAPNADTDPESEGGPIASGADRTAGGSDRTVNADREDTVGRGDRAHNDSGAAVTSDQDDSSALTGDDSVTPAESSSFASKVNAHDSDTNVRASDGVALKPDDDSADSEVSANSASPADSAHDDRSEARSDADDVRRNDSRVDGSRPGATDDDATVVNGPAATGAAESGSERTAHPEADEPTQYVPVASYGNRDSAPEQAEGRGGDNARNAPSAPQFGGGNASSNAVSNDSAVDEDETVVQSAVQPGGSPDERSDRRDENQNDSGQDGSDRGSGQSVIQAFWFAVPEPREAVDATTGMPVFTIYPGDWFLGLEDNGSWFKVRDSDGREGLLRNTEGVQRG
ncbi:MAG: hypothetical protein L0H43_05755, partial [Brevibacterium aurantiacum]|nr:hypothetical protein [Brevibacterium aurantiacum]